MIARYCDRCGKLMSRQDSERLLVMEGEFRCEVIMAKGSTWNQGDCCHDCVRAIIATSPHGKKSPNEPPTVVLRVVPVMAVERALRSCGVNSAMERKVIKSLTEEPTCPKTD